MTQTQIKIRKVSFVFRIFFQFLFIAMPIVYILAWVNVPSPIDVSGRFGFLVSMVPKGIEILHPLSFSTKFYGFLVSLIPLTAVECILYFLIKLFRLYERVEIFSMPNVRYLQKIGYAIIVTQIAQIICDGILSVILTWGNPHGHRVLVLTVSGINLSVLITAFFIILISWIMAEGCRLREEQQLTI